MTPKPFKELAKYNFSYIFINRDFGLGIGDSLKLNF